MKLFAEKTYESGVQNFKFVEPFIKAVQGAFEYFKFNEYIENVFDDALAVESDFFTYVKGDFTQRLIQKVRRYKK